MDRRLLWQDLLDLPTVPWIALGVFNELKMMTERSDYYNCMPCPNFTLEFQQCLANLELMDLNHIGPNFPWTNKRTVGFIAKKLDRLLANDCWIRSFPELSAEFTPLSFSDHC